MTMDDGFDASPSWQELKEERDALQVRVDAHIREIEKLRGKLDGWRERFRNETAIIKRLAGERDALAVQMATIRKVANKALREAPTTSLARRDAEKQAEGISSLIPRVADEIGRALDLSEDQIIELEEWLGDHAECRQAEEGAS